jgi:enoyl-CoA hydratase/carnithine racemase
VGGRTRAADPPSRPKSDGGAEVSKAPPAITLNYEDALRLEAHVQGQLARAQDYQEGVAAFFAKRAPHFTDR